MAQAFDGPPTLERSGSEHRESAVTSPLTEEEGLGEKVELPLERETEGFEKYLILKILCQRSFILFKN